MAKHSLSGLADGHSAAKRICVEQRPDHPGTFDQHIESDKRSIDSAYISQESDVLPAHHDVPPPESMASVVTSKRPKKYVCDWQGCDKAFDRPARLAIHVRSHTNERPFICEEPSCGKTFVRSEHLKAHHSSKHADDRKYVCPYQIDTTPAGVPILCGKSFHTNTKLRRHIAAHEDKEQTKCQECGQIFRKQETLQRHIRSAHLNEQAYRCTHHGDLQIEECGKMFATISQLRAHAAREHTGVRYYCDQCQRSDTGTATDQELGLEVGFTTFAELQFHLKTVHPPTCGICGHVSASNRSLRAHMEIMHQSLSDRQRFECTHAGCGRKFTKKGNLQVHVQTVHARVKAYTCGQYDLSGAKSVAGWSGLGCGVSFGTKGGLEQHVRTQHLGIVNNSQRDSQRIQSTGTSAISTITGHGYDERPFSCLDVGCESRFSREHDLAIHLELHHEWNIEEVNDAITETSLLQADKFWFGGLDDVPLGTGATWM